MDPHNFITPERFTAQQKSSMLPPRGKLLLASCRSAVYLSQKVTKQYESLLRQDGSQDEVLAMHAIDQHFLDGETGVRLERHVGGCDVFLFQALYDPTSDRSIDQNYLAFLMAVRTLREYGANHVTAILPYLAYSRQDKPTRYQREPITAKLMADLSIAAGIDHLVSWHPHSRQTRGFYNGVPVVLPEVVAFFREQYRRFQGRKDVIVVAPDAGASKLVTYLSRGLDLKSAIASKYRPEPEHASVSEIIGDFTHKRIAIVLDDMISTGGTFAAVVKKLVTEKGIQEIYGGVSHNLCTLQAYQNLEELHANYQLKELIVTNSIPQTKEYREFRFIQVRSLDSILARLINRIHYSASVNDLFKDQAV
jgi:ribose-phosphate pyrophosphokinase